MNDFHCWHHWARMPDYIRDDNSYEVKKLDISKMVLKVTLLTMLTWSVSRWPVPMATSSSRVMCYHSLFHCSLPAEECSIYSTDTNKIYLLVLFSSPISPIFNCITCCPPCVLSLQCCSSCTVLPWHVVDTDRNVCSALCIGWVLATFCCTYACGFVFSARGLPNLAFLFIWLTYCFLLCLTRVHSSPCTEIVYTCGSFRYPGRIPFLYQRPKGCGWPR